MAKTIYLEADDEITTVIDKIKKAKVADVILVIPKRATLLQSIVNLKLLKRQSDLLGKRTIVVTQDQVGRNLAERVGLATKADLGGAVEKIETKEEVAEKKPKIDLRKFLSEREKTGNLREKPPRMFEEEKIRKTSVSDIVRKIKEEHPEPVPERPTRERDGKFEFKKKKISLETGAEVHTDSGSGEVRVTKKKIGTLSRGGKRKLMLVPSLSVKVLVGFITASMIVSGVIAFLVLPRATVNVTAATVPLVADVDLTVKSGLPGIDLANKQIPGELVSAERQSGRDRFAATGKKDVGEKSKGTVIIYNKSTSTPQRLVVQTRLLASDETLFRLPSEIVVPGSRVDGGTIVPGTIEVTIEGDQPGEEFNIGPTRFTLPGLGNVSADDFYAVSETAFTGGVQKQVQVVSQDDFDKAKNALANSVQNDLADEIKGKVGADKIYLESLLKREIVETNSTAEVDAEATDFEMQVTVKLSTFDLYEKDLFAVVYEVLRAGVAGDMYIVDENRDHLTFTENSFDAGTGMMGVKVHAEKMTSWRMNETDIKKSINGKTEADAEVTLKQREHILNASVDLWPFWVKNVPALDKKVNLILDFSASPATIGEPE